MTNTARKNSPATNPGDRSSALAPDESDESRAGTLAAVVEERDSAPDECTIYPVDAADEELVTKWITAEEGSFVELDAMR